MLCSEPTLLRDVPSSQRLLSGLAARKAWEAANPELTALWNAALVEDNVRAEAREKAAELTRIQRDMPHLLGKLGVQEVHREPYGDDGNLDERATLRAARRFLAQTEYPVLFLAGVTDTGKTQAAVEVLAEWVRTYAWNSRATSAGDRHAMFAKAAELTTLARFSDGGRNALADFIRCPVLVLDDVGTEVATGVGRSLLYEVADARYGAHRRTVVTSNLDAAALKRDYDERLLRRLRESSVCLIGSTLYEGGKRVGAEHIRGVRP